MNRVELARIRNESILYLKELGYPTNNSLPLLNDVRLVRTQQVCASRTLAMYCVMCGIHGDYPRDLLSNWLKRFSLLESLSRDEARYLAARGASTSLGTKELTEEIESVYMLLWALSFYKNVDMTVFAPDSIASKMPNIEDNERPDRFIANAQLLPEACLVGMLDKLYCMHWSLVHCRLNGINNLPFLPEISIRARRRALEWMLSNCPWDHVPLDT